MVPEPLPISESTPLYRRLPPTITRRWAAAAAAETLGQGRLAVRLFGAGDPMMLEDRQESAAFRSVLRSMPLREWGKWGCPGVNFRAPLVSNANLATWQTPAVPVFETEQSTARLARPADHEGALLDERGRRLGKPRGSILYWVGIFAALYVQTMNSGAPPPLRRPGTRSRPSPLDIRGTLRILLGLIGTRRPQDVSVSPVTCLSLLLWFEGHCRPKHRRPLGRPWPFEEPPNRFAIREETGDYQDDDVLPTVEEVEPWVVTRPSIRRLAKAIDDRARGRRGKYQP